jgi:hypothetical protein
VNQHNIVPVGRLIGVSLNIEGVQSVSDFEVIKIVDGSTPYPTLLGLDWEFDNQTIIDIKKIYMVFKLEDLNFTVPLDTTKRRRYVEPIKRKELDTLYNMTAWKDNYVNPIDEGILSWRNIISHASDLEAALENWKQIFQ